MIDHFAIIGLGSIGRRHLRLVRELKPQIHISVIRSGKGKKIAEEKFADNIFYSLKDALNANIQAAVICTPALYHVEQSLMLLRAGVHVLVEKPLSNTMENIDKLLKIEKKSTTVSLMGYCLHYDPAILKYRELLSEDKIGKILHVRVDCGSFLPDWRPNQNYKYSVSAKKELGGGVLLELSHELDYINWFFGNIKNVYANINNSGTLGIDTEDSADMIFESSQGFSISLHLDFNSRSTRRICSTRCTEGDLIWNAVTQEVIWRPANGQEEVERFQHVRDEIYRSQLRHFFGCIERDQSPSVTLKDGATVLRMVKAAIESNNTGKQVKLV